MAASDQDGPGGLGGPTTASYRWIDIRELRRGGFLKPGYALRSSWKDREGRETASIGLNVGHGWVELNYRIMVGSGEWQDVRRTAYLSWTPCHFGGKRTWFLCPNCSRRCAKLAISRCVGCRVCLGLSYEVQREVRRDWALRKAQGLRVRLGGSGRLFEPIPRKPKGMHWRTYGRLRRMAIDADADFNGYGWELIARWDAYVARRGGAEARDGDLLLPDRLARQSKGGSLG